MRPSPVGREASRAYSEKLAVVWTGERHTHPPSAFYYIILRSLTEGVKESKNLFGGFQPAEFGLRRLYPEIIQIKNETLFDPVDFKTIFGRLRIDF